MGCVFLAKILQDKRESFKYSNFKIRMPSSMISVCRIEMKAAAGGEEFEH
jgi:hypothetical protein